MTATCHTPGCPLRGVPADVPDDAARVVCGGCQQPIVDVSDGQPKRRKR